MIYLFTFFISALLIEVGFRSKIKWLSVILILISMSLPAFLAGARDTSIGVDRLVYGDDVFYDVLKSQDFVHLSPKWESWIEPGYLYFNYFIGCLYPSLPFFYFMLCFIQSSFVVLAIKNLNIRTYSGVLFAAYLFLLYSPSLNMMRQSLASAISLLAISFLIKERKLFFIMLFLLAYSIHHSSLILLIYPILFFLTKMDGPVSKKTVLKYIIIAFFMFFLMGNAEILLIKIFFLNIELDRYDQYFSGSSNRIYFFPLLFSLFIFVLSILNWKKIQKKYSYGNFLILCSFISVVISQIGLFGGEYISRICKFHQWTILLLYPIILKTCKNKKLYLMLIYLYLFSYWFYHFIWMRYDQVYPYTSVFLGIY